MMNFEEWHKQDKRFSGMPPGLDSVSKAYEQYVELEKSKDTGEKKNEVNKAPAPVLILTELPQWPDTKRGVPNTILRSALFGVFAKGNRKIDMKGVTIASLKDFEFKYTGTQLCQSYDLEVWCHILHLASRQTINEPVSFTAYSMLKMINKPDTGPNRTMLHESLLRMNSGTIEIIHANKIIDLIAGENNEDEGAVDFDLPTIAQDKSDPINKIGAESTADKFDYAGNLIMDFKRNARTKVYHIRLNNELLPLFNSYTQLDWHVRKELTGKCKSLAQWLHGFYSGHNAPYAYKTASIRRLCGSNTHSLSDFRGNLRVALDSLNQKTGWRCEINPADDKVYVAKAKPIKLKNKEVGGN